MKPIVIVTDKLVVVSEEDDGKIALTREELERIIDMAYQQGKKDTPTISTPYYSPVPVSPQYISPIITCEDRREE